MTPAATRALLLALAPARPAGLEPAPVRGPRLPERPTFKGMLGEGEEGSPWTQLNGVMISDGHAGVPAGTRLWSLRIALQGSEEEGLLPDTLPELYREILLMLAAAVGRPGGAIADGALAERTARAILDYREALDSWHERRRLERQEAALTADFAWRRAWADRALAWAETDEADEAAAAARVEAPA